MKGVGRGLAGLQQRCGYIYSGVVVVAPSCQLLSQCFIRLLGARSQWLASSFPYVLALINGIHVTGTVAGTAAMVRGPTAPFAYWMNLKEEAIKKTQAWQMYVGRDAR